MDRTDSLVTERYASCFVVLLACRTESNDFIAQTGEYIAASKVFFTEQSEPLLIRGAIEGKKIVQIASGQQHSLALDSEGFAYAWGFGGDCIPYSSIQSSSYDVAVL